MNHTKQPLISVIIPVYNGELYLAEAIDSIIAQKHQSLEVLVVDDESTDGSFAVAKSYGPPVRPLCQKHKGAGEARNHGVDAARGEFIAFLDTDDLWTEKKLHRQLEAFRLEPDLDLVFGHLEHFFSPELDEDVRRKVLCPKNAIPGYSPVTLLARQTALKRIGPFSSQYRVGEFVDWYLRGIEMGLKDRMLKEVLVRRRLHADNMGRRTQGYQKDYVRILKASLDRRRKG